MNQANQNQNQSLGVNVWWTSPEFVISGESAHQALRKHGFDEEDMPLPTRRAVVSRAAYSFQDRRHKNGRKVIEKASENNQRVVYGVLGCNHRSEEEVSYEQSTTITLNKDDGRVHVDGVLADQVRKAVDKYTDAITDYDVRQFLRQVIAMCYGVAKRPTGGIYFVPERYQGIIKSAQYVLEEMGIGARLYVERVMNGENEREIVQDTVESSITQEVEDTLVAVERIEKRVGCVQNHADKISHLESMMDIYKKVLGESAKYEDLAEQLNDASERIASKMSELNDAREARESEKQVQRQANSSGTRISRKVVKEVVKKAEEYLMGNGPIHYEKIANGLKSYGVELYSTKTKSESEWLYVQLYNASRKDGSAIEQAGRGMFQAG